MSESNASEAPEAPSGTVTGPRLREGRRHTLDAILPEHYEELRVIARRQLASQETGGTLSPTGLVHEAYLKLVEQSRLAWRDRGHFFALVSLSMRHVLVDRAKARGARKRSGVHAALLDADDLPADDQAELLLVLNDAIDRLERIDPRLAQVVDCRFFGGLSDEEIAELLGVTPRTVQRDWCKARMLLRRDLLA